MATSQRKLQTLFGFTETDLNANRKGRLSAAQVRELEHQAVYELKMLLGIPMVLAGGALLTLDLIVSMPVLLVMLAIGGGLVALHREHVKTLHDKRVQKLAGQLTKHPLTNGNIQYIVSIAGQRLPVERDVYEELSEGYFAAYLLEDAHHILSIEPIAKTSVKSTTPKAKSQTRAALAKVTTRSATTKPAKLTTAKSAKSTSPASTKPAPAKIVKATHSVGLSTKTSPPAKLAKPKGVARQQQPPSAIGRSRGS